MRKTLVVPLLLLLLTSLSLAGAAHASAAALDGLGPFVRDLPLDPELLGDEEEEIEEVEWDEDEEEEEDEGEEWEEGAEPPTECILRSAAARAVLNGQGKLRLTIRYTTFEAADAKVVSRLQGSKGSLRLPEKPTHLGERGVLRLTEALSEAEAERARSAHDFSLQIRIPAAPRECRPLFARQMTAKPGSHGTVTWRQSGSIYGSGL